jgi:hypothetical protein
MLSPIGPKDKVIVTYGLPANEITMNDKSQTNRHLADGTQYGHLQSKSRDADLVNPLLRMCYCDVICSHGHRKNGVELQ